MTNTVAFAEHHCDKDSLFKNHHHVLECYLKTPEAISQPWTLNNKRYDATYNVSINTYDFTSQTWPKAEMSPHGMLWKHSLEIYLPTTITTDQALLFIDGGTRYSTATQLKPLFQGINFARIAAETHSIVVHLKDVPNQYLSFDDHIPRKEDSIIAYSWNRYLDDPYNNYYWPAHLPMLKRFL